MKTSVEIQEWFVPGNGMMYNTWALPHDHEMHPYNQAKAQGAKPEDFGIKHPLTERFEKFSRQELIEKIVALEKELTAWHKADAGGLV